MTTIYDLEHPEVAQRSIDKYVYISPILRQIKKYIQQKATNDKHLFAAVLNFIVKSENTTIEKLFTTENNNTEHWVHPVLFVYLLDDVVNVLGNDLFKKFEYNVINPLTMLIKDDVVYLKKEFVELYFHTNLTKLTDVVPNIKNNNGDLFFDINSLKEYWKMLYQCDNKNKIAITLLARLKQLILLQTMGLKNASSLLYWANFDDVTVKDIDCFVESCNVFDLGFYSTEYYKQSFTKKIKKTCKFLEKDYQKKLQNKYGGEIEVKTPVGYIDLITENKLFELKTYRGWKSAIGQLLTYGAYYPKHEKILVLFNAPKTRNDKEIIKNCTQLGITLKYI